MSQINEKRPRTLEEYWVIIRRRRWWIALPLFLAWALVLALSGFVSPKYRSETVIIIEPQRVAEQYVAPNITADVQERLQSMMQQILSRTRLQGIISRFSLYGYQQGKPTSDGLVLEMRRDIKIDLISGRPGELSAFKISYSAPSPLLAQQVTNELSSLFIGENMQNRQRSSESTTEFLGNQMEDARKSLSQQEERLRDFKLKYLGELPEQVQVNTQILSGLQTRLQAASETLDSANQQKLYLESMLAPYQGAHGQGQGDDHAISSLSAASIDAQLNRLKAELADLSTRYTPNHPDVRRVQQKIATAENLQRTIASDPKQKPDADAATAGLPASAASLDDLQVPSAVLQIRSQLAANRLKIAFQEREVKRLEKQIEDYQNRLNFTPLREQQLAGISSDYSQAKTNYESLLTKKTQSEMATNLEKHQQGELFQVIDPPNLPQKPYKPDHLKFSLLGLIAGMIFAAVLTAWREAVDVRIYGDNDLRNLVPAPLLAGIPLLQTATEQQKERWYRRLEAVGASALLAVIPAITLLAYYRG
jgi:polysaccharide chain length determinant protein (PEP-CTERM system associated)